METPLKVTMPVSASLNRRLLKKSDLFLDSLDE